MSLNKRLEPLTEFETAYSERHEILALVAILIVGLTFVTPALALATGMQRAGGRGRIENYLPVSSGI